MDGAAVEVEVQAVAAKSTAKASSYSLRRSISHLAKRVPPSALAATRCVPSGHDEYSEARTSDAQSVARLIALRELGKISQKDDDILTRTQR